MARRVLLVSLGAVVGVVVLAAGVFLVDRVAQRGRILRGVAVGNIDVSGLDAAAARQRLAAETARLRLLPLDVFVSGRRFTVTPADVGAGIDIDVALDAALAAGRRGTPIAQGAWWVRHLAGHREDITWTVTVDPGLLEEVLTRWDDAVGSPGREATLEFRGAGVEAVYGIEGRHIDRDASAQLLAAATASLPREPVDLPLVTSPPRIGPEAVDSAAAHARGLVGGPLELAAADVTATIPAADLGALLRAVPAGGRLVITADIGALAAVVSAHLAAAERPPRDATWETDGEMARVVPGEDGALLDVTSSAAPFIAALEGDRRVAVPLVTVAPAFPTEEAEALRIGPQVASFTTSYPPGEPRVQNIRRIAEVTDGVVVRPRETFSLNGHVGPRTAELGYVEAPVLYDAEYTTDVGGGVSQFATTLYNAVFFGAYQIDAATPHGFYIARYPAGREATVSWPEVDLSFTNDSDGGILIRTAAADDHVTVSLYGDNGGLQVEALAGEPYDFTEGETIYRPYPDVPPGEMVRQQAGGQGFTIEVTRVIRWPDGREVRQPQITVYAAPDEIILINPADPPPTTTTTTTTTTTQP